MDNPTLLGPWIRRFLLDYLVGERNGARTTQRSDRDPLPVRLPFVATHHHTAVDRLTVEQVSPDGLRLFLQHLETTRHCSIATRNQRLAAIHALAYFISVRSPEHVAWCGAIRGISVDIIGFKCCHRSSVHQKLAAGDDKTRGDCASRRQSPSRDPRCLLW